MTSDAESTKLVLQSEDDKAIYALGWDLAARVPPMTLSSAELETLVNGLRANFKGDQPAVDLMKYVPMAIDLVQDGGAADTRHVLSDALAVVRGACDSSSAAMARAGGQALRIASSLEATASDLAQQRGFVETLLLAGQSLSLYADHVAPPVGQDGGLGEADEEALRYLLPWAARLYTMACERDIHAAFLRPGMEPIAPPVAAVTFDDDDDGLF